MEKKYTAAYWRFKEIDAMIREGCVSKKHKKVADMAQALGVSCRTIQRDIAYMTGSNIGLPIQYNASNHTYFYTIVDLSGIFVGRNATKKEQSAIPHIEYRAEDAHTYDSSKPVHTACRIGTERCRKDGTFEFFTYEYLTIDIYGEACIPYCMQYLRNPDNTLAAACSFHPWAERENRERKMFMQLLDML